MRLSKYLVVFLLPFSFAKAQEISFEVPDVQQEMRDNMLEHLEWSQQQLVSELDSIKSNFDNKLEVSSEEIGILRRLKVTENVIPLSYNSLVKSYIDRYTSRNYRPYMNRLLGLSKYYFSVYDKVFDEMDIPREIKYLSLVESSLNPHLVSTSGAVGPWQFMYPTAKGYDLEMNSFIDERKDVYAATYAVTQYLKEAYDQFGDWQIALASYNCGRGCVQRAIKRSGLTNPNFWELSPFLPKETRNYLPKFIAMTYVLSNAEFHDIVAIETELDLPAKMLLVDKKIDLSNIAKAVDLPLEQLKVYNPAIKRNHINGSVEKPKRLILPQTPNTNDSLLYLALNSVTPLDIKEAANGSILASADTEKTYRVRRGETMASIARKFGISVQNLRAWNGLSSRSAIIGKTLIVEKPVNSRLAQNVNKASTSKKSSNISYYVVKKGDSLDRIANRYKGSSVSKLKADNNLKSNMIKPGMRLKIRKG